MRLNNVFSKLKNILNLLLISLIYVLQIYLTVDVTNIFFIAIRNLNLLVFKLRLIDLKWMYTVLILYHKFI